DVKIVITRATSSTYHQEKTSDKKGQFTVILLDATATYTFTLTKEGFEQNQQDIKPKLEDTMRQTFTMTKPVAKGPSAADQALKGKNEAITAFNDGVTAFNAKDMTAAADKFRQATELDETLSAAFAALGEAYYEQKRYPEALAAIDRYLELVPGDKRGLQDRYDILREIGNKSGTKEDKAKAQGALDLLIAADPGHDTAVRVFNLAAEASRAGDVDGAIVHLKRSLEVDPTLDQAASALAGLYIKKKRYAEAVAMTEQILARHPNDLEAMTLRYEAYRGMGNKAKADEAQAAMKAASAASTPDELFKQGVALFNANNLTAARATFEQLLQRDPNHAKGHYLLGALLVSQGENKAAKEHLEKFLALAPTDSDAETAKQMLEYVK